MRGGWVPVPGADGPTAATRGVLDSWWRDPGIGIGVALAALLVLVAVAGALGFRVSRDGAAGQAEAA